LRFASLALRVVAVGCLAIALKLAFAVPLPWLSFVEALVAAAIVVAVDRFSTDDVKDTIMIVLVSIVIAVYGAELYLILESQFQSTASLPASYDKRTKRDVVLQLQLAGDKTAAPVIYPSSLVWEPGLFAGIDLAVNSRSVLPLGGLSSRTSVLCNEAGYWATYTSDEAGFNNPPGMWKSPVDVAVIGDSFSNGNCVHQGEDWPSRLRAHVPRVLNLGMGGNGALYELATIKEFLPKFKPRVVIWQFLEANETRIPAELTQPILLQYLTEPVFRQDLRGIQPEIDKLLERVVDRALVVPKVEPSPVGFNFSQYIRLAKLRQRFISDTSADTPHVKIFAEALAEGRRVVEGWGGKLYFLYLPTALGLTSWPPPAHYASRELIDRIAREQGLEVIDLYPVLKAEPDPLSFFPYRQPVHYNSEGYALVAQKVLERLDHDVPRLISPSPAKK
jgi:hypothetical protein